MRGRAKGSKNKASLPARYKAGYISFMHVLLLRDKEADGVMWREFKEADRNRGAMAGNVISLDVALWVSRYLKNIEPKEVEVEIEGGKRIMSMDAFKELIRC